MKTNFLLISLIICLLTLASCTTPIEDSGDTLAQTDAETTAPNENQTTQEETLSTEEKETEGETVIQEETSFVQDDQNTSADIGYTVTQIDGVYYLNFDGGNELTESESAYFYQEAGVSFSSVSELYTKLKHGTFTDYERAAIKTAFAKDENGIKVFNVDQMFQSVYPESFEKTSAYWTGENYAEGVSALRANVTDLVCSGNVNFWSDGDYEIVLEKGYTDYFNYGSSKNILSHETGTWNGVTCEIYEYTTSVARLKNFFIELPESKDGEVRYIVVRYMLSHSTSSINETASETIPYSVDMFGTYQEQGFSVYLSNFDTAPTLDFLTSFGITPYVEDAEMSTPLDTLSDGGTEIEAQ